jgi:hypothetical protein
VRHASIAARKARERHQWSPSNTWTWSSRKARRHHTAGQENVVFPPLSVSSTDHFGVPPTLPLKNKNNTQFYDFRFSTVSGADDGLVLFGPKDVDGTDNSFHVSGDSATVKVWYFLQGGDGIGGNGGAGAQIDAIDEDINDVVDDDFVNVIDNNKKVNVTLSTQANDDGFVPSTSAEDIQALGVLPQHQTAVFDKWGIVTDTDVKVLQSPDLNVAAKSSEIALAFFKSPASPPRPPKQLAPIQIMEQAGLGIFRIQEDCGFWHTITGGTGKTLAQTIAMLLPKPPRPGPSFVPMAVAEQAFLKNPSKEVQRFLEVAAKEALAAHDTFQRMADKIKV